MKLQGRQLQLEGAGAVMERFKYVVTEPSGRMQWEAREGAPLVQVFCQFQKRLLASSELVLEANRPNRLWAPSHTQLE